MFHMIENKHKSDEIAESLHDIGVQVRFLHDKVKKGDFWFIDYLQDIQKIHRKEFNQPMQREIFIDLVMRTLEGYWESFKKLPSQRSIREGIILKFMNCFGLMKYF